jgi:hypothetical protein
MNTAAKLGGFALAVVLAFGGAYGIGQATGPVGAAADLAHGGQHGPATTPTSGGLPAGGLMVAQDGYPGDLTYLHVHPDGMPGDGRTAAGPEIEFMAEVPSPGSEGGHS